MNYADMKTKATGLLIRFGKAVYLRRPGSTAGWTKVYDAGESRYKWTYAGPPNPPADGTVVYVDPASVPVDVLGHAIEKTYKQSEIDNVTVMARDRLFITSDLPNPTTADKLVVGSVALTIVNVQAVQPGDTAIVWKLQCR